MRMTLSESISSYLERVYNMVLRLSSLGQTISDLDEALAVTQGIPENLKQLARAIEYSNPTSFKVGFLKSAFLR
jgi:hypothetical protein